MLEIAYRGSQVTIAWYVDEGGDAHGREFFESLDLRNRAKFDAPLRYLGDQGQLRNKEKFRHEGEGIWAIKIFAQRLFGFWDGTDLFVITSGFVKKSDKVPPGELDRAIRFRDEYESRKASA